MQDFTHRYAYSCRECKIRQQCIDDKMLSPGVKLSIAATFESHTDTYEMWEILQQNCLLLQRQSPAASTEELTLAERMRRARQASGGPPKPPAQPAPPARAAPKLEPKIGEFADAAPAPPAAPPPTPRRQTMPISPTMSTRTMCGLIIIPTQRLVRLPDEGAIVLGRFDLGVGSPPDVDLTFDERALQCVSRRHARIIGRGGQHWLEDLGSTNGTGLNSRQLLMGEKLKLSSGDKVWLGRCQLSYSPLPDWAIEPDPRVRHTPILIVTHTGHCLTLPAKDQIVLGRPDPTMSFIPDIDLSAAGDIVRHVSRRHAKIVARGGLHFVENLGSTTGLRLNGRPIQMGDAPALLRPGDQLWLGGCVVAYEWSV